MADGEPQVVSREEARRLVEDGAQLLDVRTDHEWEAGHIDGATHIDLPELPRPGRGDRQATGRWSSTAAPATARRWPPPPSPTVATTW